jgi:hypothetical protein
MRSVIRCGACSAVAQELGLLPAATAAASLADSLGTLHFAEGLVVAGCLMGAQAFVAANGHKAAEAVEQLIDTLTGTEIPAQDKLLLFSKSLQGKLAHLAMCMEFN